jgi:hypothetical protein
MNRRTRRLPDAATLERKTGLCHSSTVRVARCRWHLLARQSALMTGVLLGINTENRAGPVGLDHPGAGSKVITARGIGRTAPPAQPAADGIPG